MYCEEVGAFFVKVTGNDVFVVARTNKAIVA